MNMDRIQLNVCTNSHHHQELISRVLLINWLLSLIKIVMRRLCRVCERKWKCNLSSLYSHAFPVKSYWFIKQCHCQNRPYNGQCPGQLWLLFWLAFLRVYICVKHKNQRQRLVKNNNISHKHSQQCLTSVCEFTLLFCLYHKDMLVCRWAWCVDAF